MLIQNPSIDSATTHPEVSRVVCYQRVHDLLLQLRCVGVVSGALRFYWQGEDIKRAYEWVRAAAIRKHGFIKIDNAIRGYTKSRQWAICLGLLELKALLKLIEHLEAAAECKAILGDYSRNPSPKQRLNLTGAEMMQALTPVSVSPDQPI